VQHRLNCLPVQEETRRSELAAGVTHPNWWPPSIRPATNAEANDNEFDVILNYLARHFGPEAAQPVNVNKATAVEMECVLELTRSESKAIVQYRQQNGRFKTADDLSRIPGLDFNKIAAKKSLVLF